MVDRVEVITGAQLRAWLDRHHDRSDGVWLVTYKRHVADRYVSREVVLDELVAHGWTDGERRRVDDDRTMQWISPRRTDVWARSYLQRAERLVAESRMHPAGTAALERAERAGVRDAHAHVDDLTVPDDLAAALAGASAAEVFAGFPPSHRRNVLRWLAKAKRQETRAARIEKIATHAAEGRRVPNL